MASRWAWTTCAGRAKVMLVALAEHADQSGYCFPSLRRLAAMCEISESTAHRMIKLLASRNLVAIEQRFSTNGSRRSNGYRLALTDHGVNLTGWGASVTRGKVSPMTGCGVAHDRETTTEYPLYKRLLQPAHGDAPAAEMKLRARRIGTGLGFSKAISEADCAALEAQLAHLPTENAQQVLDELAGRMDTTRIRNPVGYCARLVERLKRGEFYPVAGLAVAKQREAREREQRTPSEREMTGSMPVNGAHARLPERIRSSLERMRPKPLDEQNHAVPTTSGMSDVMRENESE